MASLAPRPTIAVLTAMLLLGACGPATGPADLADADRASSAADTDSDGPEGESVPSGPGDGEGVIADPSPPSPAAADRRTSNGQPSVSPSASPPAPPVDRETSSPEPPPGEADGATQAPMPVTAGTYRYRTHGQTQVGEQDPRPMPEETALEVSSAESDGTQRQQRDRRRDDGTGGRTTSLFRFTGDGVVLVEVVTENTVEFLGSTYENSQTFVADPPTVVLPPGLPEGFSTTFRLRNDGTTIDGQVKIGGWSVVEIGDDQVSTRIIDLRYRFSGDAEGEQQATWRVRPDDALVVTEDSRLDLTSRGVRYREWQTSRLLDLRPR